MASHFSDVGFSLTEENIETRMSKIIAVNIDYAAKLIPTAAHVLWFP